MISSISLKTSEKTITELGLMKFTSDITVAKDLEEFLLNLILVFNTKLYSENIKTKERICCDLHRSLQEIFQLTKFYKPDVSLEEIGDILFYLARQNKIYAFYCSTINRLTFFPPHHRRYSNYVHKDQFSRDGDLRYSSADYDSYFTEENRKQRIEEKNKKQSLEIMLKKSLAPKGGFRMQIRSRHPSHDILRTHVPKLTFRSVFRLGSVTELDDTIDNGGHRVEINSIEGVKNSSNKRLMKDCFTNSGVKTAEWYVVRNKQFFRRALDNDTQVSIDELPYPIIAKSLHGSRGVGNFKLDTPANLKTFLANNNAANYIFEKFYTYSREYRLHVTSEGCFYTCRKMLKANADKEKAWQRHDDNCSWYVETNPGFDKPTNWKQIENDCVLALEGLGLDIGAFDVKVQSSKDSKQRPRTNPEYIIIESCSAPSFGEVTAQKYIEILPKLATKLAQECHII